MSKVASLGRGLPSSVAHRPGQGGRQTSGAAYTMFNPQQVKQFKEAFNMMDHDSDGRVTEADLKVLFANLGQTPAPQLLDALLSSRPKGVAPQATGDGISFTQFLSMMGEHLVQFDREHDLLEAFACFDSDDKGWIDTAEVRKHLAELGDHMTQQEMDRLFDGPFTDRYGRFNYVEWAKVLRVNDADDAPADDPF